jgi:multidrug efflux pump subunit AcrA (membrane-fusion protein)
VHDTTDVRLWVRRVEAMHTRPLPRKLAKLIDGPSCSAKGAAGVSTESAPSALLAYRRPPPVPGRKRGRPPLASYAPEELQELQRRKEAKRHHKDTWRERAAALAAERAAKQAEQAAAREERDKAAKEVRAAAKEARAAEKAAQQAKEMEADQADKEHWNQLWNSASAQPSDSGLPTCAFCHRWIIEGRPDPADCLSTGECVWYCNFCWAAWEHKWKDLTAQQLVGRQQRILRFLAAV